MSAHRDMIRTILAEGAERYADLRDATEARMGEGFDVSDFVEDFDQLAEDGAITHGIGLSGELWTLAW